MPRKYAPVFVRKLSFSTKKSREEKKKKTKLVYVLQMRKKSTPSIDRFFPFKVGGGHFTVRYCTNFVLEIYSSLYKSSYANLTVLFLVLFSVVIRTSNGDMSPVFQRGLPTSNQGTNVVS